MLTKPASARGRAIQSLAVITPLVSTLCWQPATAQETSDPAVGLVLEEVLVSARKRTENLQETPVAVSAFGAADLELRQVVSTADVGNLVPNVQFDGVASESGGGASTQMSIRGIGQTDYVLTVEPGVAVYLDGVYISKSVGSLLDTVDLEQIQVLRGPQGTLFGRNTIGGAIVLTSKQPSAQPEFSVEAITGDFDRADIKTVLSAPVNDVLKLRFSGAYQSRDGYVDRVLLDGTHTGETQGATESVSGRVTALLNATDNFDITLSLDGSRLRDESPGQVLVRADENGAFAGLYNAFVPGGQCLPSAGAARFSNPVCFNSQWVKPIDSLQSTNSGPNVSDTDVWGAGLTLDWDASPVRVKSITAYRKVDLSVSQEITGTPSYFNSIGQDIAFEQSSEELQFSGKAFDEKLQYLVGLYALHEEGSQVFPVNLALVQFYTGGLIDNESYAAFTQVTYDFTDRFAVTAGLRYTDETRKFNPQQQMVGYNAQTNVPGFVNGLAGAFGPPGLPLFPAGWYERSGSATTPSLTFDFKVTDDLYSYFTYSEGFKGGGFVMRYFPPVVPAPGTDPDTLVGYADPETAKLYEIGLKSEWLDGRLRMNAAVFRTNYDDLQITFNIDPDGTGPIGAFVPVLANAGEARIQGVELETQFAATDWLRLNASVGYLDAEYESFSALATQQLGVLPEKLPNAPEISGSAGFTLDFANSGNARWYLRADYAYRSEQFKDFTNDPTLRQGAYGLLNASLNYESPDSHWLASFGGTNLTDEIYIVSGVSNGGIGYSQAAVSRPREWFLRLKYSL